MRVLLTTVGSRGDVQPLVALALGLRDLGHEPRLCVPPDFGEWIGSLRLPMSPLGIEVRSAAAARATAAPQTPEQLQQQMHDFVADQFATTIKAARGCQAVVAGGYLQLAAPSAAEALGIRYVCAAYCPVALPSPHHPPPPLPPPPRPQPPAAEAADNRALWELHAQRWNDTFRSAVNSQRAAAGLSMVDDVQTYLFTDRPWLAADRTLAPWPDPEDTKVVQTGAWLMEDRRPLPGELETFLETGAPPVYFGFGSSHMPATIGRVAINAARAIGRRVILSRGWAGLSAGDEGPDCLSIGEVNLQALFPRVAAAVHHGGAGTTTIAARAGTPQVIVPQIYDQHYWAQRIEQLGLGCAHEAGTPTVDSLAAALGRVLHPDLAALARSVAAVIRTDGVAVAAARLSHGI